MNLHRLRTIVGIELRQRVRSVSWYVLLGIFAVILIGLLALSFASFALWEGGNELFFSLVIMLVLLLVLLVSPTLSGSAVNGDRDAATLAPVQVTLATTAEIVVGKFLAAWISGLAFLAVALPFLLVAVLAGSLNPLSIVSSLLILVVEVAVVAAIGVGLSAIVARPLFSVAGTYLIVAALTVGTLLVFGLGGAALRSPQEAVTREVDYAAIPPGCDPYAPEQSDGCPSLGEVGCVETTRVNEVPRFDRVWGVLAATRSSSSPMRPRPRTTRSTAGRATCSRRSPTACASPRSRRNPGSNTTGASRIRSSSSRTRRPSNRSRARRPAGSWA